MYGAELYSSIIRRGDKYEHSKLILTSDCEYQTKYACLTIYGREYGCFSSNLVGKKVQVISNHFCFLKTYKEVY